MILLKNRYVILYNDACHAVGSFITLVMETELTTAGIFFVLHMTCPPSPIDHETLSCKNLTVAPSYAMVLSCWLTLLMGDPAGFLEGMGLHQISPKLSNNSDPNKPHILFFFGCSQGGTGGLYSHRRGWSPISSCAFMMIGGMH